MLLFHPVLWLNFRSHIYSPSEELGSGRPWQSQRSLQHTPENFLVIGEEDDQRTQEEEGDSYIHNPVMATNGRPPSRPPPPLSRPPGVRPVQFGPSPTGPPPTMAPPPVPSSPAGKFDRLIVFHLSSAQEAGSCPSRVLQCTPELQPQSRWTTTTDSSSLERARYDHLRQVETPCPGMGRWRGR